MLLLFSTRYDVSGVGQGTRAGSDFRTAGVLALPQQEQDQVQLDQRFQRNDDPTVTRVVKNLSLPYFQSKLI